MHVGARALPVRTDHRAQGQAIISTSAVLRRLFPAFHKAELQYRQKPALLLLRVMESKSLSDWSLLLEGEGQAER
eukprot:4456552-Amphidinium_carterae.1